MNKTSILLTGRTPMVYLENDNVVYPGYDGPAHRCAIAAGYIAGKIRELGKIMGLNVVTIC